MRYALLIDIDGIGTKSNRTAKLDQIGKINRANTQTKAFRTLLSMTLIAISSRKARCILARHGLASFMFFLMPQIKLLTIVRNPLQQIMSALFAFPTGTDWEAMTMNETHKWLIDQFRTDSAFMNFSAMCTHLNTKWNALSDESAKKRYLKMRGEYRKFLSVYFWNRFVDPMFLEWPRFEMFKWSGFIFPSMLTSLLSWDEAMGDDFMRNEWDPLGANEYAQSRWIQFEWMFDSVDEAMRSVRCWMMESENECQGEKKLKFGKVERTNSFRSIKTRQQSEYYRTQMAKLWSPCNTAMLNIIRRDRPKLMLGEWKEWNWR